MTMIQGPRWTVLNLGWIRSFLWDIAMQFRLFLGRIELLAKTWVNVRGLNCSTAQCSRLIFGLFRDNFQDQGWSLCLHTSPPRPHRLVSNCPDQIYMQIYVQYAQMINICKTLQKHCKICDVCEVRIWVISLDFHVCQCQDTSQKLTTIISNCHCHFCYSVLCLILRWRVCKIRSGSLWAELFTQWAEPRSVEIQSKLTAKSFRKSSLFIVCIWKELIWRLIFKPDSSHL